MQASDWTRMLDFCSDIDKIRINLQIQCIFLDTSVCFCFVLSLPSPNKGFHKGERAAEGGPPPFVEAAAGRLLYMGAGEAENIAKT